MKIQVLGTGCPTCKKFLENTKDVIKELKISAKVEYINDIPTMLEMGVMTSPALVINDKLVLNGGSKDKEDIKEALERN